MAGTGRGHPPGTAAPPRDGRAPARRTAPTDHAAVPSRRPRAGARERVRGRGGPPHARGSEAQRRGERDDPGPAPGGVGRPGTGRAGDDTPRQRARRERRTAAAPQDERRRRRGPGRREKAGRARSQTRGRGGRGGKRRRRHADGSSPRGTRGGTPRPTTLGRARTSGTGRVIDRSPRRRHRRRKSTQAGGISPPGTQPGAVAVPHTRRAFPEDGRRRGRKSPQTHLGRRTHRHAADDGRPLSLLPSRGSPKPREACLSHPLARTHRRDRRARRRRGKALRRRRAPTRPATRRETTDRRSLQRPHPRERSRPRKARTGSPTPRRDGSTAAPQTWERCRGGGARRPPHGTQHERRTHATRATRPRSAGTAKTGKRGRVRSRRARTVDGWGPGAHRHPSPALSSRSAPRPDRGAGAPSGERGNRGPAALGRARTRPLRSRPRVTRPRLRHARHAGVTTRSLAPRGSSPDSERGGAGRSGRQHKLGFSPPKDGTRRGAPGRSYAHRVVRACQGDPKHALSSDR